MNPLLETWRHREAHRQCLAHCARPEDELLLELLELLELLPAVPLMAASIRSTSCCLRPVVSSPRLASSSRRRATLNSLIVSTSWDHAFPVAGIDNRHGKLFC